MTLGGSVPNLKGQWAICQKEKCSFSQEEMLFLGHIISKGKLRIDLTKIQAILQ